MRKKHNQVVGLLLFCLMMVVTGCTRLSHSSGKTPTISTGDPVPVAIVLDTDAEQQRAKKNQAALNKKRQEVLKAVDRRKKGLPPIAKPKPATRKKMSPENQQKVNNFELAMYKKKYRHGRSEGKPIFTADGGQNWYYVQHKEDGQVLILEKCQNPPPKAPTNLTAN